MSKKLSKRFFVALVIFSLMGQIAWVVENMYFNVFIYKIFKANPSDISLMVTLSAVSATLTSIFIGAFSDKIGKRKLFISGGYILWGVSILAFSLVRVDVINKLFPMAVSATSVGISIVIILDCVMTFFGSSANDAAFNAWLTDSTNTSNRGTAEGINAMMPLVAILVVFGGFMAFNLDVISSWTTIFIIIGSVTLLIGVLGLFIVDEPNIKPSTTNYFENIIYGFKPSTIKSYKNLYITLLAFIVFNISIQIFMPYLIIYYEVSLQMKDYVLVMAPAIILASVVTAFWGKVYDKKGFSYSATFTIIWLVIGYVFLYLFTNKMLVFIGSLLMMSGYLSGMAVFGAKIRDNTPIGKSGQIQGVRIVSQVLVPGVVGPYIGKLILSGAKTIVNSDGTTSFIPSADIFLGALIAIIVTIPFIIWLTKTNKPKLNNLKTDYEVGDIPFQEYPRPQLKRDSFINLNGKWELKIQKDNKMLFSGEVIVPFPVESDLSTVKRITKKGELLIYKRTFSVNKENKNIILHFGAVDNICKVYVNNILVKEHIGGYLPFSVDITNEVKLDINELKVEVYDNLDKVYPYGKQKYKRGGMWYTSISGIWQTVWIEKVCKNYIEKLKITPTLNSVNIQVFGGEESKKIILDNKEYKFKGNSITIDIENPKLWTPDEPYLYYFELFSGEDKVTSYFALRQVKATENGITLNNNKFFFNGLLDQGYYPDGIYLPPNEKAFKDDILLMKELGFNTLRKHIKIEPQIFYYYCDKFGMIVFQDMLNNGKYNFICDTALPTIGFKRNRIIKESKKVKEVFKQTANKIIEILYNHPSIVYYTIFNEGWGQFKDSNLYKNLKEKDSTRIWDTASGWFSNVESDVQSEHVYFKPIKLIKKYNKPLILSEFGGYSLKIAEHSYNLTKTYGYKNCTEHNFMDSIENLYYNEVVPNIKNGLCAIILTQVSDIEDETNGLLTYDRKILKVDKSRMKKISETLIKTHLESDY